VDYGLGNPGTEPSVGTNDFKLEHNITLSGLQPSTKYYYQARSGDSSGNEGISEKNSFFTMALIDKIAPAILTGPSVWAIGETSATLVWTTDEDSDSVVHYGTSTDFGLTKNNPSYTKNHQIILTDLTPATKYYFKVASTDEAGNTNESGSSQFDSLVLTEPIEIIFQNLNSGDTISGVVTIRGTVTGGLGSVKSVSYKVDDEQWRTIGSGSNFNIVLDTSQYSEGEHTIYIEAKVGEMTMQDDISFIVEHTDADDGDFLFSIQFIMALAVITIIIVIVIAVISRSKRRAKLAQPTYMEGDFGEEPPQFMGNYDSNETYGLGFIPDEEPEPSFITDENISFTPDEYSADSEIAFLPDEFGPESEVSFMPDPEPVLFDISSEPSFNATEAVKCPQCHTIFEADISSGILCPHCGFSASLKR
jgi:hypothetical protein